MVMQNMCFINSQYVNNRHANKQLDNSENCSHTKVIIIIIIIIIVCSVK